MLARPSTLIAELSYTRLSERCQGLLRLVVAEPGLSYANVARALGIPVGSIGPTRGRCLEQLRRLLNEQAAIT